MTWHTFTEDILRSFTQNVFIKMGCSQEHAELAADVLILSDLRGIDSHGVARLNGQRHVNLCPSCLSESIHRQQAEHAQQGTPFYEIYSR